LVGQFKGYIESDIFDGNLWGWSGFILVDEGFLLIPKDRDGVCRGIIFIRCSFDPSCKVKHEGCEFLWCSGRPDSGWHQEVKITEVALEARKTSARVDKYRRGLDRGDRW
jgi:hypothetical protein